MILNNGKRLDGRSFDVVHAHQPQAASLADVFQCHYLTRVAYERKSLDLVHDLRSAAVRLQQQGVLHAEDYYYRRWNAETRMLFCSGLLRQEFERLYTLPPRQEVLVNPCPPLAIPSERERAEARMALLGFSPPGPVLGYLGGLHERKGYRRLIKAVTGAKDIFLLMGGQFCQGFAPPELQGHFKSMGLVENVARFYAACDVFIVPSYFDPCPLAVFEAASAGLPVIATEGVGNLPNLVEHGAGAAWVPPQELPPLVRQMAERREEFQVGARNMVEQLSARSYGERLLRVYEDVLREKHVASV